MRPTKKLLFVATLSVMAASAAALLWFRSHQRLGTPGIRATPIPGSVAMNIDLPGQIANFSSVAEPQDEVTLLMLPKDTSYARRAYKSDDGRFVCRGNIILMGTDRTSIHKPEYCLPGQGWRYEEGAATIAIGGAEPYELPVAKWKISSPDKNGHGIYVFWFVADDELTTSHRTRVAWLARDLLTTGVLQRWAYISYYAPCLPERKKLSLED